LSEGGANCDRLRLVCHVGVFVLICLASRCAFGQQSVSGYLEYQGRQETRADRGNLNSHYTTLRVDTDSPLWKPWLAHLTMGLGLTYQNTREEEFSQTGTEITGGARLRVLPLSIFPFEAFVERYDSRIEGEVVGPSFAQTTYGFSQLYRPRPGSRYQLRYRHTDREDEGTLFVGRGSNSVEDQITFALNRSFKNQLIDFDSDYTQIEQDNPARSDSRGVNVLRHRYSPGTTFSVDTLLSDVRSEFEQQLNSNRTEQTQLSSNAFWRPQSAKPVLLTGSVLASGFNFSNNGQETENRQLTLSGSSSYQATPSLSWRSSASASESRNASSSRRNSFLRTGLAYSPSEIGLGKWAYRYSLSGDIAARTDSGAENAQEVSSGLSHSVRRPFPVAGGAAGVSLSQQYTFLQDTIDRKQQSLVHTFTSDWSASGAKRTMFLRALASDNRRTDGTGIAFQMVNLQANGSVQATRVSSWTGSASLQWTRNSNDTATSPWLNSGSANLIYRNERVFRVPLLRFSSELRFVTEDVVLFRANVFNESRRETAAWINRFDYRIGRAQVSLRGQISQVDGDDYSLVFLQLRRYFGRFAQ
jgi:hypothetical protein